MDSPHIDEYLYITSWSERTNAFVSEAVEFPSLRAYGPTITAALTGIRDAVAEEVVGRRARGESVPVPVRERMQRPRPADRRS